MNANNIAAARKHGAGKVLIDRYLYRSPQQSLRRKFFSTLIFIVIGLLLSLVISMAVGVTGKSFFLMFQRVFSNINFTKDFVYKICIFAVAALAFSFAMNVGIFNIGISGQMLAGGSTAVLIISTFPNATVANGGQILTIILAMIGGTAVAVVTGLFKVYLRINEVVTAIMLNWIILFIVASLVYQYDLSASQQQIGNFGSNPMPKGYAFYQGNSGFAWSLGVTLVAVVVVWVLMKFTVFGHKLKSTGLSATASKYYGYNDKMLQLASFAISGALAGLLGAIVYTGQSQYLHFNTVGKTALNSTPAEGFNGIAVGLIALNNPLAIVVVSVIFSFVSAGSQPAGMPVSTINLVTGVMMYIIAIYMLSRYVRPWRWINMLRFGKMNATACMDRENMHSANTERYRFALLSGRKKIVQAEKGFWRRALASLQMRLPFAVGNGRVGAAKRALHADALKAYFAEREVIEQSFRHACGYNTVIYWERALQAWKPNGKNQVYLSKWSEARTRIERWVDPIRDADIKASVARHLTEIDGLVSRLGTAATAQSRGGQGDAGR